MCPPHGLEKQECQICANWLIFENFFEGYIRIGDYKSGSYMKGIGLSYSGFHRLNFSYGRSSNYRRELLLY